MNFQQVSGARGNNFDFFRFSLALLVIFGHSFVLTGAGPDTVSLLSRGQATAGEVAVGFFFVISGFLITKSWVHSANLGNYLGKRALRIYPGFAVALLFCVLVVGPLAGVNLASYFHDPRTYGYFGFLFFLSRGNPPGVFEHNPFPNTVNGSLWTIPCEIVLYGMVAVLGLLGAYRRRLVVLLLALTVFVLYRVIAGRFPLLSGTSVPVFATVVILLYFLLLFVTGMVFCLYQDVLPYSRWLFGGCLLALTLTLCLGNGLLFTLPFCGAYVLFYLVFNRRLRLHQFGKRGDLSYGTYLYAYPVQQLLVQWSHFTLRPLPLFALAVPLTVALAALSWHFVEKPFLRLKPRPEPLPVTSLESAAAIQ